MYVPSSKLCPDLGNDALRHNHHDVQRIFDFTSFHQMECDPFRPKYHHQHILYHRIQHLIKNEKTAFFSTQYLFSFYSSSSKQQLHHVRQLALQSGYYWGNCSNRNRVGNSCHHSCSKDFILCGIGEIKTGKRQESCF